MEHQLTTIKHVCAEYPALSANGFRCGSQTLRYPDRHEEWRAEMLGKHSVLRNF
jgi:hypothetical protein